MRVRRGDGDGDIVVEDGAGRDLPCGLAADGEGHEEDGKAFVRLEGAVVASGERPTPEQVESRLEELRTRIDRALKDFAVNTLEHVQEERELLSGESIDSSGRPDRPALGATWTDPAVSGGGYGNAQLSHGLGAFLALAGEGAGQVVAHARPGPLPGIELGVAISGVLTSGATFSASGVAIHPGWRGGRQQLEVRLFGSEGQLHVDFLRDRVAHSAPDGSDVNAWMVRQGWALAFGDGWTYRSEQREAEAARRGIWAGTFLPPSEWRRRHPETSRLKM